MTVPTRLVTPALARDLTVTLERLRMARLLDPKHAEPVGTPHVGCELCCASRRLDWLCDQLPRTK